MEKVAATEDDMRPIAIDDDTTERFIGATVLPTGRRVNIWYGNFPVEFTHEVDGDEHVIVARRAKVPTVKYGPAGPDFPRGHYPLRMRLTMALVRIIGGYRA